MERYFLNQYTIAKRHTIPCLNENKINLSGSEIIDLGCGPGGYSLAFGEIGSRCVGVDINRKSINFAIKNVKLDNVDFNSCNIYNLQDYYKDNFDIAIAIDVFEHLFNIEEALLNIKSILKKNGILYTTFPPWFSPYGGHQHHPKTITKYLPFIHLVLPKQSYLGYFFKKKPETQKITFNEYFKSLIDLQNIKLTIKKFKKTLRITGFKIIKEEYFITRPRFKLLYHLPTIKINQILLKSDIIEFLSTSAVYILESV